MEESIEGLREPLLNVDYRVYVEQEIATCPSCGEKLYSEHPNCGYGKGKDHRGCPIIFGFLRCIENICCKICCPWWIVLI
jgi:hypothetical protein